MSNIVTTFPADIQYQSANFLEHPLITSYFYSNEIKAYYLSIKHVDIKRDFHPTLFSSFTRFLSIVDRDGSKVLDVCIFNNPAFEVQSEFDNLETILEELCPDGYRMLNISFPLKFKSLKAAYRKAALINHPDMGGQHDAMVTLNHAYQICHDYLCGTMTVGNSDISLSSGSYSLIPQRANEYIYLINALLSEAYCDEWDIGNSYEYLKKINDTEYFGVELSRSFEESHRLLEISSTLTKRLFAANKREEAMQSMDFTKKIYKINYNEGSDFQNKKYLEEPENVLSGRKKLRVILNHPRQAVNALTNGVINQDRYDKLQKKFQVQENTNLEFERNLVTYIKETGFIKSLPYDKGSSITTNHSKFIPEICYFENKKLQDLSENHQAEYHVAFSKNASISLIKKYTYVRLASYILSVGTESDDYLIARICNECNFLSRIYDDSLMKSKNTKKLIEEISIDMKNVMKLPASKRNKVIRNKYAKIIDDYDHVLSVVINDQD